jgi:hypothetical protein
MESGLSRKTRQMPLKRAARDADECHPMNAPPFTKTRTLKPRTSERGHLAPASQHAIDKGNEKVPPLLLFLRALERTC